MLISIGELIKKSYNLYKYNFKMLLKYVLLLLVPGILTIILISVGLLLINAPGFVTGPILLILLPFAVLIFIFIILIGIWLNFAIIRVIDALYKKNLVPAMKMVLMDTKKVVWKGLATTVVAGFYAAWPLFVSIFGFAIYRFTFQIAGIDLPLLNRVLSILFGIVGIYGLFHVCYYSIKLMFSVYAAVIDNNTIKESIKLSRALTKKRWWEIFIRLIVTTLIAYIVIMIIDTILAAMGGLTGYIGDKITSAISSIISLLITPYTMAVIVILFNEAKKTPPPITIPQA